MDVVVLAGGEGRRIRSVSDGPKAMLSVHGRPFLDYLLDQVRVVGARRVIFALGHQPESIVQHLSELDQPDLEIETSIEPSPRGTGGALRAVLPLLRSENVLVLNGDSFTQLDLCRFLEFHLVRWAKLSMVLTYQEDPSRFGTVLADEDGRIQSFVEKQTASGGGYINAGVYLIAKALIENMDPGRNISLEREVFPAFCGKGFYAVRGAFPFIDIGTPESYAAAPDFFREAVRAG